MELPYEPASPTVAGEVYRPQLSLPSGAPSSRVAARPPPSSNSLNVATPGLTPTVGTDPEPDDAYLHNVETGSFINIDWTGEDDEKLGLRVTASTTLAATGSETNLAAAGLGGALMLLGAIALVLVARRRQAAAE